MKPAWVLWPPSAPPKGHQAQPAAHPFPHHVPRAPRRQVDPTHRGDVETETIHFPKCITHKGTWNTETIHFTQVDITPSRTTDPRHDAPEGSRTPGNNTGEERPRKEWSILVTFSVTPVPTGAQLGPCEPSLWPDCTLSPLSPKVESGPVGDPVVSDPMHPQRDTPVLRQDPNTVREEPTVLSTVSLATHDEF